MKNNDNDKLIDENKDEEKDKKDTRRTLRLEARVTEDEYTKALELAQSCGLTMSDYVRRTALGHRPHLRLTEREAEALCSLSDARGDLIRVGGSREVHPSGQASHLFQRYPICGAMDESCHKAHQPLESN